MHLELVKKSDAAEQHEELALYNEAFLYFVWQRGHELSTHSSAYSAPFYCGDPLAPSVGDKVSLHQRINGRYSVKRDLRYCQ